RALPQPEGRHAELVDHEHGSRLGLVPDVVGRTAVVDLSASLSPLRDASDAPRAPSPPCAAAGSPHRRRASWPGSASPRTARSSWTWDRTARTPSWAAPPAR